MMEKTTLSVLIQSHYTSVLLKLDHGVPNPCKVIWLDPEPDSDSSDYEKYIIELHEIERQVDIFRGFHYPPTEEQCTRLWAAVYKDGMSTSPIFDKNTDKGYEMLKWYLVAYQPRSHSVWDTYYILLCHFTNQVETPLADDYDFFPHHFLILSGVTFNASSGQPKSSSSI